MAGVRGKDVLEDLDGADGRTTLWPSVPRDLCNLFPASQSTSIVCALCGYPKGGLRYVTETDHFEHRNRELCTIRLALNGH